MEVGANVNLQNCKGDTALHCAVQGNDQYTVRCLISHAADCNIVNQSGASALHIVSKKSVYKELIKSPTLNILQAHQFTKQIPAMCYVQLSSVVDKDIWEKLTANEQVWKCADRFGRTLQDYVGNKAIVGDFREETEYEERHYEMWKLMERRHSNEWSAIGAKLAKHGNEGKKRKTFF